MRQCYAITFLVLMGVVSTSFAADAVTGRVPVLDTLKPQDSTTFTKVADGYRLTVKDKKSGRAVSPAEYKPPFVINVVAKTDSTNLRLLYGEQGKVIFNWEVNGTELRVHDPANGNTHAFANKGAIPPNTYVTIRWIIDQKEMHIEVDGVERASVQGDYSKVAANVGIGTNAGATLTVQRFYLSPLRATSKSGERKPININVDVPCELPKGTPPVAASQPASAIERPEYQNFPKALVKNLVTVNGLYVLGGTHKGGVLGIIATVSAQSRRGKSAGAGFFREDGDDMMKTAFEEAIRAVNLRYPLWGPGHLDFSFDEKSRIHGGPSAGTAFAVATLSALEGFDIDAKCALTGDIAADWKVRPVGGVPYKILGAEEAKLRYIGIPDSNEESFSDMGIMIGAHAYWDAQVFSLATLQDALAFARTDRAPNLLEAMRQFAELQEKLKSSERPTLQDPQTVKTLKKILELAPNHLSAKYTLAVATKSAPTTLSEHATLYCIVLALSPWQSIFVDNIPEDQIAGVTVDPAQLIASRKFLDILRKYSNKKYAGDIVDIAAFIETAGSVSAKSTSLSNYLARRRVVFHRFEGLVGNSDTFDEAWASGY